MSTIMLIHCAYVYTLHRLIYNACLKYLHLASMHALSHACLWICLRCVIQCCAKCSSSYLKGLTNKYLHKDQVEECVILCLFTLPLKWSAQLQYNCSRAVVSSLAHYGMSLKILMKKSCYSQSQRIMACM